jgi:tetratricopeptide (TPR) repeat protein
VNSPSIVELEKFILSGEYDEAESFCLEKLKSGKDMAFWKTQLGYVYFLNEQDLDAYYDHAPTTFQSLVEEEPTNVNAHFWLGYLYAIVLQDFENAVRELRQALALDPNHAYANLVLSAYVVEERGTLLRKALEQQPNNLRALLQFAELLVTETQYESARELLNELIRADVYVEKDLGIINTYVNDVLTGSSRQLMLREEAVLKLKQIPHHP